MSVVKGSIVRAYGGNPPVAKLAARSSACLSEKDCCDMIRRVQSTLLKTLWHSRTISELRCVKKRSLIRARSILGDPGR